MTASFKALIVVLAIAIVVFRMAKPIALRFSAENDFARRRNVWFILTITAFLSPSFWLYALLAFPLFLWAGRKDSNPVAFYLLLLQVIPETAVDIPTVGIQELFQLDNYRLLSFCVLIPTAWRLRRSKAANQNGKITSLDVLLLGFGLLQILLFVPPDLPNHVLLQDSATNLLRRAFLFFIDTYILYYVVSRSCLNRRAIVEALAAFCLACVIMAMQGVFEGLRHWLLYADLGTHWGIDQFNAYMHVREGLVRAQAAAGDALALGYLLAIAVGFWLYLRSQVPSGRWRVAVFLVLCAGLLATYSRGTWIGATAIYFAFTAIGPRALPRMLKAAGIAAVIVALMSVTPFGEKLINSLPFFGGTTDIGSYVYRQRLAERSWEIIQQHPLLGDQLAWTKMEDLRQGEGIIDIVNTYAHVALFYGLIGLSLFVGFILLALVKSYRQAKRLAGSDPDFALLGVGLAACIVGVLLMISDNSFRLGVEKMFYVLAGLAAAYVHLGKTPEPPAHISPARGRSWEAPLCRDGSGSRSGRMRGYTDMHP